MIHRTWLALLVLLAVGPASAGAQGAAGVPSTPLPHPSQPPGATAAPAVPPSTIAPPTLPPSPTAAPAPAPGATGPAAPKTYDPALVKRGEYLVRLGGCGDCHTPVKFDPALGMPVPDLARAFSGHPVGAPDPTGKYAAPDIGIIGPTFTSFALPFGIVYSANITSDPTTGIGAWTEQSFIRTLRTGKRGGVGRPVLPPMPWFNLVAATDDDLRAMVAYLLSTPPIKNAVPRPSVPPEAMQQIAGAYDRMLAGAQPPPGAVPPAGAQPSPGVVPPAAPPLPRKP